MSRWQRRKSLPCHMTWQISYFWEPPKKCRVSVKPNIAYWYHISGQSVIHTILIFLLGIQCMHTSTTSVDSALFTQSWYFFCEPFKIVQQRSKQSFKTACTLSTSTYKLLHTCSSATTYDAVRSFSAFHIWMVPLPWRGLCYHLNIIYTSANMIFQHDSWFWLSC